MQTRTLNLPQVPADCAVEFVHRNGACELRLDASVAADHERPRLGGQVPLSVPRVETLTRVIPGIYLDMDEANARAGECPAFMIDNIHDWPACSAGAPARRGERDDERNVLRQRVRDRVLEQALVGRNSRGQLRSVSVHTRERRGLR